MRDGYDELRKISGYRLAYIRDGNEILSRGLVIRRMKIRRKQEAAE